MMTNKTELVGHCHSPNTGVPHFWSVGERLPFRGTRSLGIQHVADGERVVVGHEHECATRLQCVEHRHRRARAARCAAGVRGLNGNGKNQGQESIDVTARRRVRGFAAAAVFMAVLLTTFNLRTIATFLKEEEIAAQKGNPRTPARESRFADAIVSPSTTTPEQFPAHPSSSPTTKTS